MAATRIIARLDVKGSKLIKGIHLEGWRYLGDPTDYCLKYYEHGIDEIIYIDAVASLYNRDNIKDIVRKTTENVFVPLTVGGGIRTLEDAQEILRSGADKVAVNTGAIKRPELITEISQRFGRQCMVLSIQAKKRSDGTYVAAYDSAREYTDLDVVEWAKKGVSLGAGEILLTSVDNEGTRKGFDISITEKVAAAVNVPVIACGGFGQSDDLVKAVKEGGANAVAIAHCLHYNRIEIEELRQFALAQGITVRANV